MSATRSDRPFSNFRRRIRLLGIVAVGLFLSACGAQVRALSALSQVAAEDGAGGSGGGVAVAGFSDDFADGAMDAAVWRDLYSSGEVHWATDLLSPAVTVAETAGELRLALPAGVGSAYGGYLTVDTYDFTAGAYVQVEIPQPALGTSGCGNHSTGLVLVWGGQYTINLYDEIDSKLVGEYENGLNNWTSLGNVSYNVATHRWLRIEYRPGIPEWSFQASGDGVTWTEYWTQPANFGGPPSAVYLGLYAGNYCNLITMPTPGRLDNFSTTAVKN